MKEFMKKLKRVGCYILKIYNKARSKQISVFILSLSILKYLLTNKNIIVATKTVITNRKNIILNKNSELRIGRNNFRIPTKYDYTIINISHNGKLFINGRVALGQGTRILIANNAEIYIGNNTYITGLSKLICHKRITIGSNCAISWNVQIMDTDFHYIIENGEKRINSKPIIIGDHVWIGSNVSILKGVNIGSNSVIAANSVVTRDVPACCLVAGNPAKVIKNNISWEL
jgi:acetyltransferase-like isoleucine patch superfamily enzyme